MQPFSGVFYSEQWVAGKILYSRFNWCSDENDLEIAEMLAEMLNTEEGKKPNLSHANSWLKGTSCRTTVGKAQSQMRKAIWLTECFDTPCCFDKANS